VREPARFITEASPTVVYVTHHSRAVIVIANPRVSGDTVHGTYAGDTRPVAVPLSQVQSVEAIRRDGGRTAVLIGGVTLLAGIAVYAFVQEAKGHNDWTCDWNSAVPRCG